MIKIQIQKKEKKKKEKPINNVTDLIKISNTKSDGILEFKSQLYKSYVSAIQISGVDIFGFMEQDQKSAFESFASATLALGNLKHKYIFTKTKTDLSYNREFVKSKLSKCENDVLKEVLNTQLGFFDIIEDEEAEKKSYLLIYSNRIQELENITKRYINCINITLKVKSLNTNEFRSFLDSYVNINLIDNLYPKELSLSSVYYKINDDMYCSSLVATAFPSNISDLTFANIFSSNGLDDVTLDCEIIPKSKTLSSLKSSLDEIESRNQIVQDIADELNNNSEFSDLQQLYVDVNSSSESIIKTTLRFFVYGKTKEELETKINEIHHLLYDNGITLHIPENDFKNEFLSKYLPYNSIGTTIPLHDTLKKQFPFYFESIIDEQGFYIGDSYTNGLVMLDTFKKTDERTSFDKLIVGLKGSGKSVLLKADIQDILAMGNKVMILDVEGEYKPLCEKLGGKEIMLTKSSIINPLEIRKSVVAKVDNETQDISDEEANNINFTSEVSRITIFFTLFIPSITEYETSELNALLLDLYASKNIYPTTDISKLTPYDFPIFSDLLALIQKRLYVTKNVFNPNLSASKIAIYERLESFVKELSSGLYGSMFNGISTVSITDENLIVFNVSALSELIERIQNAQLFQIITMMWNETCDNVTINKSAKSTSDMKFVVSVIDEAHRFINTKNLQCVDFINKMLRRSRKYDAALWFASQSVTDFLPNGNAEGADTIKNIFNLVQYKYIMKQSSSSIDTLHYAFPQFTISELYSTDVFTPGQFLLSYGGGKNKICCKRVVPKNYLLYMGSTRDKQDYYAENENNSNLDEELEIDTYSTYYDDEENNQDSMDSFDFEFNFDNGGDSV